MGKGTAGNREDERAAGKVAKNDGQITTQVRHLREGRTRNL